MFAMRIILQNGIRKLTGRSALHPGRSKSSASPGLLRRRGTTHLLSRRNAPHIISGSTLSERSAEAPPVECSLDTKEHVEKLVKAGVSRSQAQALILFLEFTLNRCWARATRNLARVRTLKSACSEAKNEIDSLLTQTTRMRESRITEPLESIGSNNKQISQLESSIKESIEKAKSGLALDINLDAARRMSELEAERELILTYFDSLNRELDDISKRISSIKENTRFYVGLITSILILACLAYRYSIMALTRHSATAYSNPKDGH